MREAKAIEYREVILPILENERDKIINAIEKYQSNQIEHKALTLLLKCNKLEILQTNYRIQEIEEGVILERETSKIQDDINKTKDAFRRLGVEINFL